jgi:hypothetical protein
LAFVQPPASTIKPNAGHQALPEAEAQRTLEAVGSMPLFGLHTATETYNGKELQKVTGFTFLTSF